MKNNTIPYLLILLLVFSGCVSQKNTNIQVTSPDIADNLDLQAVASVFGEVRNLEEFERILNDENEHLSNLDLNNDGFIDYLRVVESVEGTAHLITIQAALGNNVFQDVATIDVDRNYNSSPYVQVIGNPYFYGNNYIINPVYYGRPFYMDLFWSPYYAPWQSPFYYSNYPSYYRPWNPWPVNRYVNHVVVRRNVKNTYNFTNERRSTLAPKLQSQVRRDDYSSKQPNGSFDNRNKDVRNKADLDRSRRIDNTRTPSTRDNRNDRSRGTQSSPARTNPSTPETRTSRGEKRANPTPSTGSSRSRNSSPSSTTPTTKKSTKRGN